MKDNQLEVSGKTCCPTCGQTLPEPELSVEILEELFDYDPLTGFVTFKYRPRKYFNVDGSYNNFNLNYKGKRVGSLTKAGFRNIRIFYKSYYEHRVIWALYYKKWPPKGMVIDHINGDSADNRIDNLRLVTYKENSRNTKIASNNKSGVTGVTQRKNRWISNITNNGKLLYLGSFSNFDDAVKARKDAEIKFGFHDNHGRDNVVDG
tara:strand:+ start:29 stop:646 length:618 start_codon:yes stop_codon:yes gene_type:complete